MLQIIHGGTVVKLRCPRCKTLLADQEYEGENIKFCQSCFGHWLTREQLDKIVNNVEYKFSEKEATEVLQAMVNVGDESRIVDEKPPVACPECDQQMERQKYHPKCPVRIDECARHGIWLDTGEIKDLQVFIEKKILGHQDS